MCSGRHAWRQGIGLVQYRVPINIVHAGPPCFDGDFGYLDGPLLQLFRVDQLGHEIELAARMVGVGDIMFREELYIGVSIL